MKPYRKIKKHCRRARIVALSFCRPTVPVYLRRRLSSAIMSFGGVVDNDSIPAVVAAHPEEKVMRHINPPLASNASNGSHMPTLWSWFYGRLSSLR